MDGLGPVWDSSVDVVDAVIITGEGNITVMVTNADVDVNVDVA
nr:hypothetical protein [Paenibacillus xylanexedens]